jgi:hypothetical protein
MAQALPNQFKLHFQQRYTVAAQDQVEVTEQGLCTPWPNIMTKTIQAAPMVAVAVAHLHIQAEAAHLAQLESSGETVVHSPTH